MSRPKLMLMDEPQIAPQDVSEAPVGVQTGGGWTDSAGTVGAPRCPSSLDRRRLFSPPDSARLDPAEWEARVVATYLPLAYALAAQVYIPGADLDDARQEALLGLLKGVRNYDPEKGALGSIVYVAIQRQLWTAIKTASREKQRALNESERNKDTGSGGIDELIEQRDRLRRIVARLDMLSPLERRSLARALNGEQYVGDKAMDNGLVRAREKLRAA